MYPVPAALCRPGAPYGGNVLEKSKIEGTETPPSDKVKQQIIFDCSIMVVKNDLLFHFIRRRRVHGVSESSSLLVHRSTGSAH